MTPAILLFIGVLLAGCYYNPARDPSHVERCEAGLETEFCG